jgi:hypothetical protein
MSVARVELQIAGRSPMRDFRWGTEIAGEERAMVLFNGRMVMSLRCSDADVDGARDEVTFFDKRVPQALAKRAADEAVALLASNTLAGAGRDLLEALLRAAVLRGFGCSCRHPSGADSVYIEDVTCPLHGTAGPLTLAVIDFSGGAPARPDPEEATT